MNLKVNDLEEENDKLTQNQNREKKALVELDQLYDNALQELEMQKNEI